MLGAIPETLTDRMLTREEIAQEVGRIVGSEELGGTEEAAREVTRRYLAAYVPATREEFARWFGTSSPAQLGYELIMEHHISGVGFGQSAKPDFWIREGAPSAGVHVAFASQDDATVDAFHDRAIVAGRRDNGQPGLRPEYHSSYYGAYVLDPDGNNIEAVCHRPQKEA